MNKFCTTVLVFLLTWATAEAQSCLPQGITFTTQGQVDSFSINYPGCSVVEGDVKIEMQQGTNLNGLQALQGIGGDLTIASCPFLTNLQGLNNVGYIGGSLLVGNETHLPTNSALVNLQGLDGLLTIGEDLRIRNQQNMISLNGLENLTMLGGDLQLFYSKIVNLDALYNLNSINGDIIIQSNSNLENLHGLQNIGSVIHGLTIEGAAAFDNLDGLENITTITENVTISSLTLKNVNALNNLNTIGGALSISHNPQLHDITGLSSLHSVNKNLDVVYNDSLTTLIGLDNLDTIGGSLNISYNPQLHSIAGLASLHSVNKNLDIVYNDSLTTLMGLNGLQSIGASCSIKANKSLVTLDGLENISHIGTTFSIDGNPVLAELTNLHNLREIGSLTINANMALTTLSGLDSLESIEQTLWISKNFSLTDLSALSHLVKVGLGIAIENNQSLSTLVGLQNIETIVNNSSPGSSAGPEYIIYNNPSLSVCSIYSICKQLLYYPGAIGVSNNAPGCNTLEEIEAGCDGKAVVATVISDYNDNCQANSSDGFAEGILVRLSGNIQQTLRSTKANGNANFVFLGTGSFTLSLPQFPSVNWEICQDTLTFLADTIPQDTIRATFFVTPLIQCPQLTVDLGLPSFFRGCLAPSPMQVVTRNIGTIPAEDARVAVIMPDGMELMTSTPPLNAQSGDTLFFDLGELVPFQASTVSMVVRTTCAAVETGTALCLEAFATFANPCPITTPPASEIRLFSECMNDTTVRFTIKNVGDAPTQALHEYVIIEDEVILHTQPFNLEPLGSLDVDVQSNGATYRMEATKYDDGTLTATAVENCNGFMPGFITAYWLNDGLRDYDFDCREIRNAYDPNQKTAIPTGVGPEYLLAANKTIQYTIDFQNTGTDTAFRVQLLDILPEQLDVNSFRPGFSSHPYTWEIRGADTLEVLFYPIMLPDSNVNEATSHGWFSFEINQRPNLPDGTTIENRAAIVFDYNPPIITNTVLHTIGKLTVSVDGPPSATQAWQIFNNPTRYAATFKAKEFISGEKRFELSDAMGRIIRTEHFSGQDFEFRRGLLAGGLYYFRIVDARGRVFSGKILISD